MFKANNLRVAYQGNPGSFSEIALREFFGEQAQAIAFDSFDKAYMSLLDNSCDFGVLPLENSLIGTIHPSFDTLVEYKELTAVSDLMIRIQHHLVSLKDADLESINTVYSQWPAIEQCKKFLNTYPQWELKAYSDTAASAKFIAEHNNPHLAAISSQRAAEIHKLKILKENIETNPNNFTRFLVTCKKHSAAHKQYQEYVEREGLQPNTGFVVFKTEDSPGALLQSLSVFNLFKINMHKIESRPILGRPWEYQFSVELDFQGDTILKALQTLEYVAKEIHIVGLFGSKESS